MTRIPVGRSKRDFEAFSSNGFVFPVVGGVVGGVMSVAVLGLVYPDLPPEVGGFLYLLALFGLQGINHSDGLADFADGLSAHGSESERREAMRDLDTGIGGSLAVSVYAVGLYAVSSSVSGLGLPAAVSAVFVSEVTAKTAVSLQICLATASHEGHGSRHTESTPPWHAAVSVVLAAVLVAAVPSETVGVTSLLAGLGAGVSVTWLSGRAFGGVSGDVFGATNEVVRLTSLLAGVLVSTVL